MPRPICDHPVWVELGRLGRADWFRCRDCGLDITVPDNGADEEEGE